MRVIIKEIVPSDPELIVTLWSTDVKMLKDIRDKVGLVAAVKVCRLLAKGASLKDAMNYVRSL